MAKTMQFQELKEQVGMGTHPNPQGKVSTLRPELLKTLEIRNRQQFVKRYKWITLSGQPFPYGFDPDIVERILYYRYNLIIFVMLDEKGQPKFFTTPYALNGTIDVYGRYRKVSPLTFNGSIENNIDRDTGEKYQTQGDGEWLTDLELIPTYDIHDLDPVEENGEVYDRCVILQDYENGISQKEPCRYILSKVYNDMLADIVALIRHNLVASARTYSYRVMNEGEKEATLGELEDFEREILEEGKLFFPITSTLQLETVFDDKDLDSQEYWECFVSMDNLREQMMGIENNGEFHKKERELQGEAEKEASQADLVYADGLEQRQKFCELVNALYGTDLWCIESEAIEKVDLNEGEEEGNSESESTNKNSGSND